jgi:CRISPR type III-B/RAMP module-associated protein Cmr3
LRVKQIVLEDKKSKFYQAPADLMFSWVEESKIPFYHIGKSEASTYRLINLAPETVKPVKNTFLDEEQLKRYLSGQIDPLTKSLENEEEYTDSRFFLDEPHIKNQLESPSKVSRDEGGLYMYYMKRIKEGVFFRVVFEAAKEVQKAAAEKKEGFVTLGGESRVVHYRFEKKENNLPYGSITPDEFFKHYKPETDLLKLILATPAVVYDEVPAKIKEFFHVKGIAVSGEVPVGGWGLRNNFPKPMVRAYLPGTVFLVQPRNGFDEKVYYKILDTLFSDERPEEGFGAVLIGIQKNILSKK